MKAPNFRLSDWRTGTAQKREFVRSMVLEAVSGASRIDLLLERAKEAANFELLPDRDKNGFNVMASQARAIVREWQLLDGKLRADFVPGSVPYSTVYAALRAA